MKIILKKISSDEKETKKIAHAIVEEFIFGKNKSIIFLLGELGSGKTTFTRFALERLGISEKEFNGSPTFTIVNEYRNNIYHIDLYRLNSSEDIFNAGVYEYLEKEGIFFIEWPEKLIVEPDLNVEFKILGEKEREISVYIS